MILLDYHYKWTIYKIYNLKIQLYDFAIKKNWFRNRYYYVWTINQYL